MGFLVSLVGLPPTAGFTAKLFVFSSLWESYAQTQDMLLLTLLIVSMLSTVVALFYYLKIPYYMFIKSGESAQVQEVNNSSLLNYFTALMVLMILVLFFKPDWLMELIYSISFEA